MSLSFRFDGPWRDPSSASGVMLGMLLLLVRWTRLKLWQIVVQGLGYVQLCVSGRAERTFAAFFHFPPGTDGPCRFLCSARYGCGPVPAPPTCAGGRRLEPCPVSTQPPINAAGVRCPTTQTENATSLLMMLYFPSWWVPVRAAAAAFTSFLVPL